MKMTLHEEGFIMDKHIFVSGLPVLNNLFYCKLYILMVPEFPIHENYIFLPMHESLLLSCMQTK